MRVVSQDSFGEPEVLKLTERPAPQPATNELLVRIGAAGINPVDLSVRAGRFPFRDPPFVLGWNIAGTVETVGGDAPGFSPGDRVFGLVRFPHEAGGYAEYATVPANEMLRTPDVLTDIEAAALPLAGLTAWQALVEIAGLRRGDNVLIHAGAGGVGHLAVQIAKALGARVTTTASWSKADFVQSLGADEVIDYQKRDFTAHARDIDVVLDAVGGDHAARSLEIIKPDGVVVCLIPPSEASQAKADKAGLRLEKILVRPDAAGMAELAKLVSAGSLRPHVARTFPLEEATEAHRFLTTSPIGKVVLEI